MTLFHKFLFLQCRSCVNLNSKGFSPYFYDPRLVCTDVLPSLCAAAALSCILSSFEPFSLPSISVVFFFLLLDVSVPLERLRHVAVTDDGDFVPTGYPPSVRSLGVRHVVGHCNTHQHRMLQLCRSIMLFKRRVYQICTRQNHFRKVNACVHI